MKLVLLQADPILREVYRMKDELAREIGNDPAKLVALLREDAKKHPDRMFRPLPSPGKRAARRTATGKR